jgi:hypothetical protein
MSDNPNLQPVKKRKKHAPDRQQPEWLFPADSENPALKPHKEPTEEEKLAKQRSIDFLSRRAVGAPMKSAPPVQLLNLIGAFLAEYNFTSTGRLFATERQGRSKIDGWKDNTGGKLEKGMPTLGKIYKEWRKEWEERRQLDMTSSDEEDDAATKREKMLARREKIEKLKNNLKDNVTSSSGSSSSSESEDSDVEMQDAPRARKSDTRKASISSSSSLSSTSSDSDADDEEEAPATKTSVQKSKSNNLKRKSTSSSSSSGSSSSSSDEEAPKAKKVKATTKLSEKAAQSRKPTNKPATGNSRQSSSGSSSDSSSSSSGSDSESSTQSLAKKTPLPASSSTDSSFDSDSDSSSDDNKNAKLPLSSDTSATLSDGHNGASANDISAKPKLKAPTKNKKFSPPLPPTPAKKREVNEPFSRIPKDIKVDPRLASNAYIPYDYAQQAHQDLIVTKGKGFTKEKNKKKRGSYRGGYIDVEGKKGVKFDD